jgi:hypothetical protein
VTKVAVQFKLRLKKFSLRHETQCSAFYCMGKKAPNKSIESRLDAACAELHAYSKPNLLEYASTHCLPYYTLRRRFLGLRQSRQKAHGYRQLLSPNQESVLVEWLQKWSDSTIPISKRTLTSKVSILCGRKPGKNWAQGFLARNPAIKLGKASGLDPKRAQALNREVVKDYYAKLKEVLDTYNIPIENIYNMDEKGCQ